MNALPTRIEFGTCVSGFRFWFGMNPSSSMKYSASARMIPATRLLYQLDEKPTTDSSLRSRIVTIGSAHEHVRPAGVCPTAPKRLVTERPALSRQDDVRYPRSSMSVSGTGLNGPVSLKPSSNALGAPVRSG